MANKLTVGIVGYDGENYNQDEVSNQLTAAFETIKARYPQATDLTLAILSGSQGVPAFACTFAVHYYGWQTMAVIGTAQEPSDTVPISHYFNVNGDVVGVFFEVSSVLLRVGNSQWASEAVAYFKRLGGEVYEYEITTR